MLVSVCMITYNHEKYIEDAIKAVLMQKTAFPIELIIGEDFSSDNTRTIVKKFAQKYPEILIAQLPDKNKGMVQNFLCVLNEARGKYIALCEGDDYWTDPLKLQKQVDFLEANPKYGLIYSDVEIIDSLGSPLPVEEQKKLKAKHYFEGDIFFTLMRHNNCINTLTTCFRKELINDLRSNSNKRKYAFIQDYFIWLMIVSQSKVKYMNETGGRYRRHPGNISQDPHTIVGRKTWRYSETLGIEYFIRKNKNRIAYEDYIYLLKVMIFQIIRKRELFLKFITIKSIISVSFKYISQRIFYSGT